MSADHSKNAAQVPSPDEGDPPRSERDPHQPTETAPDSVEESVYEEAEYVGQEGSDAADPPTAAGKSRPDRESGHGVEQASDR